MAGILKKKVKKVCERCGKELTEQEIKKQPKGAFLLRKIGVRGSFPILCDRCRRAMNKTFRRRKTK